MDDDESESLDYDENSSDDESFDLYNSHQGVQSSLIMNYKPVSCEVCEEPFSFAVQPEIDKYMQLQNEGLSTSYKCPRCRDCKDCQKGAGRETMSIRQEHEQELIQKSIRIDENTGKAIASLAFIEDPVLKLKPNKNIAIKRAENVCKRYSKYPQAVQMICKGLQNLLIARILFPWKS